MEANVKSTNKRPDDDDTGNYVISLKHGLTVTQLAVAQHLASRQGWYTKQHAR